jgi:hypothetical protein
MFRDKYLNLLACSVFRFPPAIVRRPGSLAAVLHGRKSRPDWIPEIDMFRGGSFERSFQFIPGPRRRLPIIWIRLGSAEFMKMKKPRPKENRGFKYGRGAGSFAPKLDDCRTGIGSHDHPPVLHGRKSRPDWIPEIEAFDVTERTFEQSVGKFGMTDEWGRSWIDLSMKRLRSLVIDIEAGGGRGQS